MIKALKNTILATTLILACSSTALADGNAFTPLTFDDASYSNSGKSSIIIPASQGQQQSQEMVGNSKMQSAILELDNAQVDVRNELLNYKAKYSDVDAQYQLIKAERKALDKQIKSIEKRIKQIDKSKEVIRKNML